MANNMNPLVEMEALEFFQRASGMIPGLLGAGDGPIHPLQAGAMGDPECSCAVPTACFRSVSQRSLNVPTRFSSQTVAEAPASSYFTDMITAPGTGAIPGIGLARDSVVFNDANTQPQRARVADLVLIAIRARANVFAFDGEAYAAGSMNVSEIGNYLEDLFLNNIYLSLFHSADRSDPWVDKTPLSYFAGKGNRKGMFYPVPPLKWIQRDPAMGLSLRPIDFGNDPGAAFGVPTVGSFLRTVDMKADLTVECLFIPNPDQCGNYWPGMICPKETIGNSRFYTGGIKTARIVNGARG